MPANSASSLDSDLSRYEVEVFKTDVSSAAQAAAVVQALRSACPELRASFDLEDCDRVLCLRSSQPATVSWDQAVAVVRSLGVQLQALPD